MKTLLIHNPAAGMRTDYSAIEAAARLLAAAGWQADVQETHTTGDGMRMSRLAADRGYDVVFAVGGDGTVNEVLNGLVGSESALGVLPYGTANVWAKEMGLPLGDLATAARLQMQGRVQCIDVGQAAGAGFDRAFVLWCGVGFDAAIAADLEPQRAARRRFGALMWWLVGLRTAFRFRGRVARIRIDARERRMRVLLGLASNVQLYGGLVRVSPAARLDDGLLDLALFRGTGAWRTAWHLVRVFLGWHLKAPDVEHYRAREIVVRARRLPVHVDAEPVGVTPVTIRVRPHALRILVPPAANLSLFSNVANLLTKKED